MKNIINYILLLFLRFISLFIVIKIGEVETRSVGHYSKSIDIYLSEKKFFKKTINQKPTLEIWFTNKFVANKFLLKKWKDILFIIPYNKFLNFIFVNLFFFLKKVKSRRVFLVDYRDWRETNDWQLRDVHKIYMKSQQNLLLSKKEIEIGEETLSKIIPDYTKDKKLICIHCRDSFYHVYKDGGNIKVDKDWGDKFRNVNIDNFIQGISLANSNNYVVIRVGNIQNKKIILDSQKFNFIDYSFSKYRSDFMDLFLAYKANMYLGSDSGVIAFPGLFRKKMMMHNVTSVKVLRDFDDSTCSLVNFKKIYSKKLGRLITFSENHNLNIGQFYKDADFLSNELEIIESSEDEIENFIQECIWIEENKNNSYFNCRLQDQIKKIMSSLNASEMTNIKISPYFLNKYQELIK
jgi:putative glycosyltransferase (TIGR04372 family)